jgi:hypothetical protein
MEPGPRVLLIDDGELDDVLALARELGAVCARVAQPGEEELAEPHALLVASGRRALGLRLPPLPAAGRRPHRVAVVDCESRTLRGTLRRIGFELLVRRPVHPEALRLLLSHLLHSGPERRILRRVPIGMPIAYRAGLLRHAATLTDLSPGGCRLLCRGRITRGRPISVYLVDAAGRALALRGRVLRAGPAPLLPPVLDVAVAFEPLGAEPRGRLARLIEQYAGGPARWRGHVVAPWPVAAEDVAADPPVDRAVAVASDGPAPASTAPGSAAAALEEPPAETPPPLTPECDEIAGDQRRHARRSYDRRVIALGAGGARVVLGRDLSLGGMRVEGSELPPPGQRLSLALHGGGLEQPLVLRARVVREDGAGAGVVFDPIEGAARERLSRLLEDLPLVESLLEGEDAGPARVVVQIVDDAPEAAAG